MKLLCIYIIVVNEEEFVLVHSVLVEVEKKDGVVFFCVTNDDKTSRVFSLFVMILDEVEEGASILCFRSFEELRKLVEEAKKAKGKGMNEGAQRAQRARLLSAVLCILDSKKKVLLHPPTITTDTAESINRNIMIFCCLFIKY